MFLTKIEELHFGFQGNKSNTASHSTELGMKILNKCKKTVL